MRKAILGVLLNIIPATACAVTCTQLAGAPSGAGLCIPQLGTDFDQWSVAEINTFTSLNSFPISSTTSAPTFGKVYVSTITPTLAVPSVYVSSGINISGNVGIGTTSPATILHVNSTINNAAIIKSTGKGVAYGRTSNDFGEVLWGVDGIAGTEINTGGLPYASFIVSNSTNALQLGANASIGMTIVNGGNVGIGTASPLELLSVNGTSAFSTNQAGYGINLCPSSGVCRVANNMSGAQNALRTSGAFWELNDNSAYLKSWSGATIGGIYNAGTLLTPLYIGASGNIGAGSINPVDKVHISSGNLRLDGSGSPGIIFPDGTKQTTATAGSTGSNNTWTGTNTFNSSVTFNGSTNIFQKITSTTAVNDSCVGFTNLVASTTYVVEARGLRGSAAYMMLQANLDTGGNYYGGWRYVNGINSYAGSVNGGTNIPLGDTVNAFAGSFKARIEVITDQGLVKRVLFTNQFTAPNAATDTYYGEGTSGGVYNGSATFSSLQVCASAGTWNGMATLYRMND